MRSFLFAKEQHFQSSDLKMLHDRGYTENCLCKQGNIVIRYIEVDFMFWASGLCSLYWPGHRISFIISRTSLNRGSLNRGSTIAINLLVTDLLRLIFYFMRIQIH